MVEIDEEITFHPLTRQNIGYLRRMHRINLPVHYGIKLYNFFLNFCNGTLAYINKTIPIGEIVYKIELDAENNTKKMYIMTIGVLPKYQKKGVGSMLLNKALDEKDDSVKEVYLHVHVDNILAINFYTKHGFEQYELINDYYKNLENNDAYIFRKVF